MTSWIIKVGVGLIRAWFGLDGKEGRKPRQKQFEKQRPQSAAVHSVSLIAAGLQVFTHDLSSTSKSTACLSYTCYNIYIIFKMFVREKKLCWQPFLKFASFKFFPGQYQSAEQLAMSVTSMKNTQSSFQMLSRSQRLVSTTVRHRWEDL